MIAKKLREIIAQAAGVDVAKVHLEHPELAEHGDFSTNIALATKINAKDLAAKIKGEMIAKVEVAGPGFINIWLKEEFLLNSLKNSTVQNDSLTGKKMMVEFTDPNPFKEFHIGHLYSNIVGESICRLLESQGAQLWRVCYQGDVGLHVAKSIWGMQTLSSQTPAESASLADKAAFLGQAYAYGATKYEEDETAKGEINALNKKIYDQDTEVMDLYNLGRRWSLAYFDTIYARLGTKFNKHYFESEAGKAGLALVKTYLTKGVFKHSEGAIIFPGEDYGVHTRVFINSMGLPTYEAKELGLAPTKYQDFAYDLSIIITGNEVNDYFKVLAKALEQVSPDLAAKTKHLSHGMVRLPSGKMSSRTGKILTGEWLMDEAKKHALGLNQDEKIAEKVGLAAIKYALLKSGLGIDVEFDFDESVTFNGNSGPYLQYTFARTQSVLKKNTGSEASKDPINSEELAILRFIYRYSEVVAEAASRYAPNLLTNFLYELAQRFNTFYNMHQILGNQLRLDLTKSTGEVLQSGLTLLGIEALSKM